MNSNLMGAAGFQFCFHPTGEGRATASLGVPTEELRVGRGFSTAAYIHRHLLPIRVTPTDCALDSVAGFLGGPIAECPINPLNLMLGKSLAERQMSGVRFGDHKSPTRVLVDSMNDPGSERSPDSRKILDMMKKCVDKGPFALSARRVHREARGFVEYHQMCIFEEDLQGPIFWDELKTNGQGERDLDPSSLGKRGAWGMRQVVYEDFACFKQLLNEGAARFAGGARPVSKACLQSLNNCPICAISARGSGGPNPKAPSHFV